MKAPMLTLLGFLVLFLACQSPATEEMETTAAPVDLQQVETEVGTFIASFAEAQKSFNIEAMRSMLTDDALICGTDPGELWSKEQVLQEMQRMSEMEGLNLDYTAETEKIMVADDGQSAMVLQQMTIGFISPHIPVRWTFHVVKEGESWLMDFSNIALIPRNQDLPKINAAYEDEGS